MPTIKINEDNHYITMPTTFHCKVCGGTVSKRVADSSGHFVEEELTCDECGEYYYDHINEHFDPWRPLLDEFVKERIRNYYQYSYGYDESLYNRVLEEMKEKIRRILVEDRD